MSTMNNDSSIKEGLEDRIKELETIQEGFQKLKKSEERRQSFMDSVKDSYHVLDENLNILDINKPALLVVLEANDNIESKTDVIGKNIMDIYPFMNNEKYIGVFDRVLKNGISEGIEDEVFHPIHGNLWICADVFKTSEGIGLIASNISERKKAEEELQKHQEHLEEIVSERTADLEKKNAELERYNNLFIGREFRIKELREKVKILEQQIKDKN